MPRHRRAPKVKLPKPIKLARPKSKDLRLILKGLITPSQSSRIATLNYANVWYDAAVPYLHSLQKITAEGQKRIGVAIKCRKQAAGTNSEPEKELSLRKAVELYEKACAIMRPPAIEKFYKKFEAHQPKLEKKKVKLELKFGAMLQLLEKAFGMRVKLQVADAPKLRQYDPALTTITYNREAIKELSALYRAEGIQAIVFAELPFVALHIGLVPHPDQQGHQGELEYDPEKQLQITEEILTGYHAFCKSAEAPRKLVRNGVVKVKQPRQPSVPTGATAAFKRAPRSAGPKVGGFLDPGSAIGIIYTRLEDQQLTGATPQWHPIQEVILNIQTGDPVGRVKQLQRYGIQKGQWAVEINNDQVRMTLDPAFIKAAASLGVQP